MLQTLAHQNCLLDQLKLFKGESQIQTQIASRKFNFLEINQETQCQLVFSITNINYVLWSPPWEFFHLLLLVNYILIWKLKRKSRLECECVGGKEKSRDSERENSFQSGEKHKEWKREQGKREKWILEVFWKL